VGDEAFTLKTYLVRPYPGSQSKGDNEKRIFNFRLSQARRVVENAFGILSQKFQIYQRTLQSLLENADIIFATCILHNYLTDHGVDQMIWGVLCSKQSYKKNKPRRKCPLRCFEVRDKFKQFFNCPSATVPWQNERV